MDINPLGYDESLDSPMIDPDPDFRAVLRFLNASGVHTVSSCQGHAPGTQYDDVQVWMDPYITCVVKPAQMSRARRLLRFIGAQKTSFSRPDGKLVATFRRRWRWKRSTAALIRRTPTRV